MYSYIYVEVEVKQREGERIHSIFQDPLAQHLFICLESRECLYVARSRPNKRAIPRSLPKVKGHLIQSVAWNKVEQSESATGPILLGTSSGERPHPPLERPHPSLHRPRPLLSPVSPIIDSLSLMLSVYCRPMHIQCSI